MSATFTGRDPRSGPMPDPISSSATEGQRDGTAGGSGAADPATTAPVDKSNWLYCRGCNSFKPPEGRKGFRCSDCAAKAKNSPNRWVFNERGDLISKGKRK